MSRSFLVLALGAALVWGRASADDAPAPPISVRDYDAQVISMRLAYEF